MKRIFFLSFYLLTLLPLTTSAAPAYPFPITVKQPDGTMKQVLLHGDEHHNWMTTLDGVLLRESPERIPLAMRAPAVTGTNYFPHNGTPRVLVILAAYPDCDFTLPDPRKSFDQCLNSFDPQEDYGNGEDRNICSVAEYFTTVSYGNYAPLFDVVGPVMLPEDMATYGKSENLSKLCKDACNQLLEAQPEFDFTPYDNDSDGKVDMVYIVHAGYSQNMGGSKDTMWSCCSTINISINDQVKVAISGCHSELAYNEATTESSFGGIPQINGTGVFIHEFSHGMGLPDIYATNSAKAAQQTNNQSMQRFDIMDVGCYNGNSWKPAPYNAWEQEAMGWLTIEELGEPITGLTLTPILEGGTAYKIPNPLDENEYIILENIQKRGINSGAYSHGLLVYHFAYAKETVNMGDAPNNEVGKPRVAVIPAGKLLISSYLTGDNRDYTQQQFREAHEAATFPGSKNITTLTDDMKLPNFRFYTTADESGLVGHCLYNIAETSDGIVTLDYDEDSTTGITTLNSKLSTLNSKYYTLDGRSINGQPTQKGIYIYQGKKTVVVP